MMSVWSEVWNGIVAGLNVLLQSFYKISGNYGIAIILLTILVKLVLLPLTVKQTRSMIAMQKIQPEIRKIQEKYKDDKEKLSQEMMKFYKENKINPLGGCLPLLLQLPIFFALFTVLRKYLLTPPALIIGNTFSIFKGVDVFGGVSYAALPATKSAGFLWMGNLADTTRIADPYFVLIILLAASTWYSQKQVMTDPRQKNMMIIMPVFTAFIGFSLPAGVVLYWLTTNVLQILQQFGMEYYDRKFKKKEEKPRLPEKAGSAKTLTEQKRPAAKAERVAVRGKNEGKAAAKQSARVEGGGKQTQTGRSRKKTGGTKEGGKGSQAKGKSGGKTKTAAGTQKRRPKGPPPTGKTRKS